MVKKKTAPVFRGAVFKDIQQILIIVVSAVESATASVKTTTAAARCIRFRSCFVYYEGFAQEVETVKACDSLTGSSVICHFDKTETTTTLCYFVHDDLGRRNFAILFE